MRFLIEDGSIAVGLMVLLLGALEAGFRFGRAAAADPDLRAGAQVGAIQAAMLGLLGLLLAFSFAAAGSRFIERQDLIVTEANAIGTAYLRADLLDEPQRQELRSALKAYTEHRLEISANLRSGLNADAHASFERDQTAIWKAGVAGVTVRPGAMLGVLPPLNDVIDLHSTRVAAGKKHLPLPVMVLLIACSVLSIGVIGYGSGLAGRRRFPLTVSLTLLIVVSLWITIDLDYPRAGLLQLSDAPLRSLKFD